MGGAAVNAGFATAAVLSLVTFAVHTFVGGRFAARPLLAAPDLDKASRWLNYMTWHMVTALLVVMTAGYGVASFLTGTLDVALLLTVIAAILSPLSVWVALKGGIAPWRFPSSWLFALIVLAALWGIETGLSDLTLYATR